MRLRAWLEFFSAKRVLIPLFLAAALPTGSLIALVNPIGEVPDETAHASRALGLLRGEFLGHRAQVTDGPSGQPYTTSGFDVNAALFSAAFGRTSVVDGHPAQTRADVAAEAAIPNGRAVVFAMAPNTVRSFPALYVPAALGLSLGRRLHLAPYVAILLGRLFMLGSFLAMGVAALWCAAFGESLFLAALLMPESLFLAASFNVDGQIIGAACLGAALLTRFPLRRLARPAAVLALTLLACAKPPYLALLALGLVPLRAPGLWRRAAIVIPGLAAVAVWSIIVAHTVLEPFRRAPFHPGPLYAGNPNTWLIYADPAANLRVLLADPIRLIALPLHSIRVLGAGNLKEAVGLFNFLLPDWFYTSWNTAFVLAILGALGAGRLSTARPPALAWSAADAVWAALIVIATFYGIELSTYLSWSHTGDTVADGVTGRYFLPLIPFLAFLIPRFRPGAIALRLIGIGPVAILALFDVVYLPLALVRFYDLT